MKLILFDGYCSLCNKFVDYVLRKDVAHVFRLAPLQGKTAAEISAEQRLELNISNPSSVIYIDGDEVYKKSDAVLRIMTVLSKTDFVYRALLYLPKIVRDPSYELVAKYRYKLSGKQECRIPTQKEKNRILP